MDADKAGTNLSKHGVSFDEAATAFGDPLSITIPDPVHSHDEDRYILLGSTYQDRLLVVVHTERADRTRLLRERQGTGLERRAYEG